MADEINTTGQQQEQGSRSEDRIRELSGKVKDEAEARVKAEQEKAEIQRERDFYQGFSDIVATNPAAKDHKDDILSKVKSGYTVEDATYAVLGKAGKLGAQTAAQQVETSPAGGSASTVITQQATKSASEMTQAERRALLEKDLMFTE